MLKQDPIEFLKKIENELVKYQKRYGFHFLDQLIDEIKKYNNENKN